MGTKKQVQQWGRQGGGAQAEEEEGHLSQMLLIVGELTLGYHNVEVIGTLGKVI